MRSEKLSDSSSFSRSTLGYKLHTYLANLELQNQTNLAWKKHNRICLRVDTLNRHHKEEGDLAANRKEKRRKWMRKTRPPIVKERHLGREEIMLGTRRKETFWKITRGDIGNWKFRPHVYLNRGWEQMLLTSEERKERETWGNHVF